MQKKTSKEFRMIAEEKCSKFSNKLALIFFVYSLLMGVVSGISSGFASILVTGPVALSLLLISKKVYNAEEPEIEDLLEGFKDFGNTFVLYLLQSIFVFLWSLLFIIPGIIKAYSYSMALYIYEEDKTLSATQAIEKSKQLMDGNKFDLFKLHFSYLGWYLLGILTCGILFFWIQPKVEVATYAFYLNITGKDVPAANEQITIELV